MEKEQIKVIVVDGVVESVFSSNPNVVVTVEYTSFANYQKKVADNETNMTAVY